MEKTVYGIDLSGGVTPLLARDVIINCFVKAHADIFLLMQEYQEFKTKEEFDQMKDIDVKLLIKSLFEEVGEISTIQQRKTLLP